MSNGELEEVLEKFPLLKGYTARVLELQEPVNYGTNTEMCTYEGQVRLGYRLHLHPFVVVVFNHYKIAPCQLVPNGWRKLVSLIYLVETSGFKADVEDLMKVYFEMCIVKNVANCPGWYYIYNFLRCSEVKKRKTPKGKRKEKSPIGELPPVPKKASVSPLRSPPHIIEGISIEEDPIFRPRWTIRRGDTGLPNIYAYAYSSQMLAQFDMARDMAYQIELEKREALANSNDSEQLALKKKYERAKKNEAEAVNKWIQDYLDGNASEEWLKKSTKDGLEIYELAFQKAKDMFKQRFPQLPLDDFIMPAFGSPSWKTATPTEGGGEAGDVISQGEVGD
ncbi:hypothetical protein RJ640_001754 [Escallonia rubra]|uniref:Transposase (putative) gypsy type domain-containing protein n=1 Tax=Escallonia rubra TaxID=112253 RepID=A0AA88RFC5_9ASTE|nr:hypothetical protein RJ640_001754 [Escallonia rubra]